MAFYKACRARSAKYLGMQSTHHRWIVLSTRYQHRNTNRLQSGFTTSRISDHLSISSILSILDHSIVHVTAFQRYQSPWDPIGKAERGTLWREGRVGVSIPDDKIIRGGEGGFDSVWTWV